MRSNAATSTISIRCRRASGHQLVESCQLRFAPRNYVMILMRSFISALFGHFCGSSGCVQGAGLQCSRVRRYENKLMLPSGKRRYFPEEFAGPEETSTRILNRQHPQPSAHLRPQEDRLFAPMPSASVNTAMAVNRRICAACGPRSEGPATMPPYSNLQLSVERDAEGAIAEPLHALPAFPLTHEFVSPPSHRHSRYR